MKSPTLTPAQTFESTLAMIKGVADRLFPDSAYHTGRSQAPERAVRWGFGVVSPKSSTSTSLGQYVLEIKVRHGAFGEIKKVTQRKWWNLTSVTETEVMNAVFAALTFPGSPYHFNGKKWLKRMEVM